MDDIMVQFAINASDFGLLAAFYYYGYAAMQIPTAMLLDRFGTRYVVFIASSICGISMLLFIYTSNFYLALFSRTLIGAASAAGFLGVSKTVSEWFDKDLYSRMIGFSFTLGLMGAIYGGRPVNWLIDMYGGANIGISLSSVAVLIGVAAFVIVRSPVKNSKPSVEQFKLDNFKSLLQSPKLWYLAIANLLMVGALEGFADIWGVQYLMNAYNLSKSASAGLISFVFFWYDFWWTLTGIFK